MLLKKGMMFRPVFFLLFAGILIVLFFIIQPGFDTRSVVAEKISDDLQKRVRDKMLVKFGKQSENRIERGVSQVATFWNKEDGTFEDFEAFCLSSFATDPVILQKNLEHIDANFSSIMGHLRLIISDCQFPLEVASKNKLRVDELFEAFFPLAYLSNDLFAAKVAFFALLNFQQASLAEKLRDGPNWTREQWAQVRFCDWFVSRAPRTVIDSYLRSNKKFPKPNDDEYADAEALLRMEKEDASLMPFHPIYPRILERSFDLRREISSQEVERLLTAFLESNVIVEIGTLVSRRLKRPLHSLDLWYEGFRNGEICPEDVLNAKIKETFPDLETFSKSIAGILIRFGFSPERAGYLQDHIVVESSNGQICTCFSYAKTAPARLLMPVLNEEWDYKTFSAAMHELGHCVENILSLANADFYLMSDSPELCKECFPFLFQNQVLDFFQLKKNDSLVSHLKVLDEYLMTFWRAGVSLVEIRVWQWLERNPRAGAAQLVNAKDRIEKDVWNAFFKPIFNTPDCKVLGKNPYMFNNRLYYSNYPISQIIQYQIMAQMRGKSLGAEMERISRLGRLPPGLWMKSAVGSDISPEAFIHAARQACKELCAD